MGITSVTVACIRQVAALQLHNMGTLYGRYLGTFMLAAIGRSPDYSGAGLDRFHCTHICHVNYW